MKPPRAEAQSDADRKVPFRGGGFAPRITRGPAVIAFAVLIALWQAAVSWRIANPLFLPSPIEIGRALYALAASGELWLQRVCLIFQLMYKEKTDAGLLFGYIRQVAGSKEFFLQKGAGWALRQYSKTNPDAVRRFLAETTVAPLTRREGGKYL